MCETHKELAVEEGRLPQGQGACPYGALHVVRLRAARSVDKTWSPKHVSLAIASATVSLGAPVRIKDTLGKEPSTVPGDTGTLGVDSSPCLILNRSHLAEFHHTVDVMVYG